MILFIMIIVGLIILGSVNQYGEPWLPERPDKMEDI